MQLLQLMMGLQRSRELLYGIYLGPKMAVDVKAQCMPYSSVFTDLGPRTGKSHMNEARFFRKLSNLSDNILQGAPKLPSNISEGAGGFFRSPQILTTVVTLGIQVYQKKPTSGPKDCKYYLYWPVGIPKFMSYTHTLNPKF